MCKEVNTKFRKEENGYVTYDLTQSDPELVIEFYENETGFVNMYAVKQGKVVGVWQHCECGLKQTLEAFNAFTGNVELNLVTDTLSFYEDDLQNSNMIAGFRCGKFIVFDYGIQGGIVLDYIREYVEPQYYVCGENTVTTLLQRHTEGCIRCVADIKREVKSFDRLILAVSGGHEITVSEDYIEWCVSNSVSLTVISPFGCMNLVEAPYSYVCEPLKQRGYRYIARYDVLFNCTVLFNGTPKKSVYGVDLKELVDLYNQTQI